MSKVVIGEEGGLGKPFSGQKRVRDDCEILLRRIAVRSAARALSKVDVAASEGAEMHEGYRDGEPLAGQKRSRDAEILQRFLFLSKVKKSQLVKSGASEGAEMHGATTLKDPYEGVHYPARGCVCNTEEGSQDPLSSWESDPLRKMFLDWAADVGRVYESEEEKKFRFKIWCSAKKMVENAFSKNNPGFTASINNLSWLADRTLPEQAKMTGSLILSGDPYNGRPPPFIVEYLDTLGEEEVKKAWKEFDEWAERHKRDYGGSSEERTLRFHAYVENKRNLDLAEKRFPGGMLRYEYDLDNMDKFIWEARIAPKLKVARCPRCGL